MVLDKILRVGEGRKAKKVQVVVEQVLALEPEIEKLSDTELKAKTDQFRARLADGETVEDIKVEAFAVVREAAWRVLAQKPYPVQVFGGLVLHGGNIAEMRTGEGKTLTSTMPVYLNALAGGGVHVVTVNDYLAGRDQEWMGRVHHFLGLTTGLTYSQQPREAKKAAYACDITYGTTNEFGFDYLRDNMAWSLDLQVQRGHNFALIDEVDSILIDEARTPLIISGAGEQSAQWYQIFARRVVPNLVVGADGELPGETTGDYVVDEAKRTVAITEDGVAKVEKLLGIENMYESVNTPLIHHLQNSLKAKELFKRDREYIVVDGEVKIVDDNTGRVLEGRRYSEGLHQSIEAKEGVRIKEENQTLATVTLQNYYRTYDKLAGMTGTAMTEEVEFIEIYELGVVEVPTNMPVIRDDHADLIYKTEKAKFEAAVEDIAERVERGQPVLVGTTSVEKSELVARLLTRRGIKHNVLNAKQHEREAHIVAQAGQPGSVTVATNMAGRGTDIILGGNHEELAKEDVAKLGPDATDEEKTAVYLDAVKRYGDQRKPDQIKVIEAGGLYVIATERHESRRIDNQLRGRSGRQGDPGASRFYLSLEDDLMRLFNASMVERIMDRLQIPENVPIEHKMVSKAVQSAQGQVESRNFDIRKNVLKYDDVLNEQRKVIYGQRQRLITGELEAVGELAHKYMEDVVVDSVDIFCPPGVFAEEWDLDGLAAHLAQIYPVQYDFTAIDLDDIDRAKLTDDLLDGIDARYDEREAEVGGPEFMREIERRVVLSVVDRKWREHLYEMDALRDGIGLRAVGQRDPLVEYQREAYDSFIAMMGSVKEEAVTYFFHLPVNSDGDTDRAADGGVAPGAPGSPEQPVRPDSPEARQALGNSAAGPAPAPAPAATPEADEADEQPRSTMFPDGSSPAAQPRVQPTQPQGGRPLPGVSPVPDTSPTFSPQGGRVAPQAPAASSPPVPRIVFEQPKERKLDYSSSQTAGSSYSPGAGSSTTAGGPVEHREDGTTVRQVAAGGTYRKEDSGEAYPGTGRNDPCPCGSGQKFKRCHGA